MGVKWGRWKKAFVKKKGGPGLRIEAQARRFLNVLTSEIVSNPHISVSIRMRKQKEETQVSPISNKRTRRFLQV